MAEYIEREAALAQASFIHGRWDNRYVSDETLRNIPAADVIKVVWCKNCKYASEHYDTDGNVPYWTCSEWDSGTDYDGFCYLGEQKDG